MRKVIKISNYASVVCPMSMSFDNTRPCQGPKCAAWHWVTTTKLFDVGRVAPKERIIVSETEATCGMVR